MLKKCSKCNEDKDIINFTKNTNCCKSCIAKYQKEYRKTNKTIISKQKKKHYKLNKDLILEQNKEYRKENGIIISEKKKSYYNTNKDLILEQKKLYYEANKDIIVDKNKIYRKSNISKMLWRGAHKRTNILFDITIEDIERVIPKDNICPLLNIEMKTNDGKMKYNSFTLDRMNSMEGYVENNIQVISNKANRSKSNSNVKEYEILVCNLEKYINDIDLIAKNGGNYDIDLKGNLNSLRERTKKYNLPKSNIDLEYLKSIYPKDNKCPLLNIEMKKGVKCLMPYSPTLDRIIPELGYVKGNVMFISHRANTIKNNLTLDEMKLLLFNWKRIIKII